MRGGNRFRYPTADVSVAPRFELDQQTAAFVDGAADVPIFAAIKKFAEYDATYAVRPDGDAAPFRS